MDNNETKKQLNTRLPAWLVKEVYQTVRLLGQTVTQFVQDALVAHVERAKASGLEELRSAQLKVVNSVTHPAVAETKLVEVGNADKELVE